MAGAIRDRYVSLGGPCGFLGEPLTAELATPVTYGRFNRFQGGSIYWTPAAGAWEVHGAIRDTWGSLGWEQSALGFPITNENRTPARPGAYNRFQAGSIYWSPTTGAHEVRGAIQDTWRRLGWENGALGFPRTNENPTPTKPGAFNHFEAGSIYWSPATSAHEVRGAIRDKWAALGWESSPLGFPITDETATPGRAGAFNHFQVGSIYWSPATGAHEVRGAIRDAWAALGWESSPLGFPVGDEYTAAGARRSDFQKGYITWTPQAGAVVHQDSSELSGTVTARDVLDHLAVANEASSTGYDRSLFVHWVDADANGCDTRQEVLIAESLTPVTVEAGCTVTAGQWFSYYDAATWTNPTDVDIDHVVALEEAWGSGAQTWTAAQRQAYANDLTFDWSLQAVTDSVNQSKGSNDPADWLPPLTSQDCTYATHWASIKYRWRLTVDSREQGALATILTGACGASTLPAPPRAL